MWWCSRVSSFQLQLTKTFRPKVAVMLNFAANHLDWHADLDEYLDAKLKIFAAQRPGDEAIVAGGYHYGADRPAFTGPGSPGTPPLRAFCVRV